MYTYVGNCVYIYINAIATWLTRRLETGYTKTVLYSYAVRRDV